MTIQPTRVDTIGQHLTPRRHCLVWLWLAALLLIGVTGLAQAQDANGVCRVTTGGSANNSGKDWGHPMDLPTALNYNNCKEDWVAQGVYFTSDNEPSFTLRPDARVYGGFVGNETSLGQRNAATHVTVLSGDSDQNDTNTDGNQIDETINDIQGSNSENVVQLFAQPSTPITDTTVLDGFTITGGDGRNFSFSSGAGLLCSGSSSAGSGNNQCSPTLSNLVFVGNVAMFGGAMYLDGGGAGGHASPLISHVVFSGNQATSTSGQTFGGALYCNARDHGVCSPSLTDVVFTNNSAGSYYGGAMFNDAELGGTSSPTLSNVTFSYNSSAYWGGAMINYGYGGTSSPSLFDVTFDHNSSGIGGALINVGQVDPNGNPGTSNPTMRNVTFSNNHAQGFGGAVYNSCTPNGKCQPTLTNVTFSDNSAVKGGAIYSTADQSGHVGQTLTNVIFWGNTASSAGANLYIVDTNFATTSLIINYSVVQNGDTSISYATGAPSLAYAHGTLNVNGNPMLGPLANNGGFTQTMLPGANGDALNDGTCNGAPLTDQRGVARPTGPGCDIGAVEAQADTIFKNGFE